MSEAEMDSGGDDSQNVEHMVDAKIRRSLESHKNDMLKEIGSLFEKISENSNNSQLNKISNIMACDIPKFKRKSNEEQFKHNAKVHQKLVEAEQLVDKSTIQCKAKLAEGKDMIGHRQKMIQLADSSELGWRVVHEYENNPLADDSDDERRMYKAEARANRKLKAERSKKSKSGRPAPYRRPVPSTSTQSVDHVPSRAVRPDVCFQCGKVGHWKKDCPGVSTNIKMSIYDNIHSTSIKFVNDTSVLNACQIIDTARDARASSVQNKKGNTDLFKASSLVLSPVGKLKQSIDKWRSVAGESYILEVINSGYRLPFKCLPSQIVLKNNKSARDNPTFVESEIDSLLKKGVISEVKSTPFIVNPLTVAYNRIGKPRLVLDCRHINPHLHLFKVKFEDIFVALGTFHTGSYLFTFDLKSAYHHINVFPDHRKFLGFHWVKNDITTYYVYNSLPFGIATAGHIFTKVLRVVVSFCRAQGHKVIMFLDDGIGGHHVLAEALKSSIFIKSSLKDFGFLLAEEKCSWEPSQKATWLGHVLDYNINRIFITQGRISRLLQSIDSAFEIIRLDKYNLLPVRTLASIVGQIISLHSVLKHKVRIKTREMYNCILARASWNSPVIITNKAIEELLFWKHNVAKLNASGKSITKAPPCEYTLFCDASGEGYGGYVQKNTTVISSQDIGEIVGTILPQEVGLTTENDSFSCRLPEVSSSFDEVNICKKHHMLPEVGSVSEQRSPEVDRLKGRFFANVDYLLNPCDYCSESNPNNDTHFQDAYQVIGTWDSEQVQYSSTWREIEAVHRVLKSSVHILNNTSVKIYSDNKNVKSILLNGSRNIALHSISTRINEFCVINNITIRPDWIPRNENQLADYLSRCKDSDDWSISETQFNRLDSLWGFHTVDRFSSSYNNRCKIFNSRWWVPGTAGVNAFDQFWVGENNWIVPPPRLVSECLNKIEKEKATCTLVVPIWHSAVYWPMLFESKLKLKSFIKDFRILPRSGTICIGKGNNGADLKSSLENKLAKAGIRDEGTLAEHMSVYVLHSRADNTVKKYNGYFKRFKAFCEFKSLSSKPANYMTVALFLTHLLDENKSNSVVSSSAYAIKWMHSIYDLPDPTDNSVVRNLLEASKRLRSKPVVKKDIVDPDMLQSLCAMFENNMTLVNLRDLSMILICYAGFLRFKELSSLCCNDVIFNETHIVLKIRVSKTDIYRNGSEVLIARGNTIACPYKMLQNYMSKADLTVFSPQFLFRPLLKTKDNYKLVTVNKQLSYTRAKECIVSKLRLVAPGLKLGTHTLRASGATAALNFGKVSERCIKRHGRWKSDQAKDGYIQDSLEERLFISKHLGL